MSKGAIASVLRTPEAENHNMYAESRVEKPLPMYVPRDERFEESKQNTFTMKRPKAVLHNLIPGLKASLSTSNQDFNEFSYVDGLYSEGLLIKGKPASNC
ncbi:hypothetical protein VIGAN_11193100 [Vigna angularis var. angularis]|uniref:Lipoxygenase domain-containing protein n=1 Tax=Vigna angularis var. angularis TaxID=157739 RepID=A0A0S3TB18_PHAAN|nr:hypothetical protein VIGAN_11193100 [Vigna angularis var. angularis]